MLNPESVDSINKDKIEIEFTDDRADTCLKIQLENKDASDLAKMINKTLYGKKQTKYSVTWSQGAACDVIYKKSLSETLNFIFVLLDDKNNKFICFKHIIGDDVVESVVVRESKNK